MKLVIDFITEYWREIASVLCLVISVVIHLIKKRPLVNILDSIKEDILETLPVLINQVECDGNGQRKKIAVVNLVNKYVEKKYQIKLDSLLFSWLSDAIEDILSTPSKKGDN